MIGIDNRNTRKSAQMVPGDRIVFYIRDSRRFVATATVKSRRFRGRSRIWKHHSDRENFNNRVRIEPDIVADEPEQQIDAYQVGPTLEYVKRWVPEQWNLAFFDMVHILSQRDFDLLEGELKRHAPVCDSRAERTGSDKPSHGRRKRRGARRSLKRS